MMDICNEICSNMHLHLKIDDFNRLEEFNDFNTKLHILIMI